MKIYSYSACGTCKKAIKWLEKNNFSFELVDILSCPPSKEIIIQAFEYLGERKLLLNTSGKSYRTIGSEKIKQMSNEEVFEALSHDSKLIKRPFLITDERTFLVGFNEERWESVLLSKSYAR